MNATAQVGFWEDPGCVDALGSLAQSLNFRTTYLDTYHSSQTRVRIYECDGETRNIALVRSYAIHL